MGGGAREGVDWQQIVVELYRYTLPTNQDGIYGDLINRFVSNHSVRHIPLAMR